MIEIQNLSAGYPGTPVLEDVSLTFPKGKVTVIAGPNGCGKSTLLKTLAGIHPHTSGRILIENREISAFKNGALARKVAYLSQSRQIPDITVRRMVLHGRFPYLSYPRRYRPQDMQMAEQAMARMGIGDLADRSLATLSGGTRQKVYIAMALAQDTPVILMDEPTTFLDIRHQLQIMEHARCLADSGKTVVLVLHDLPLALQTADRLAVLSDGKLQQWGDPETVCQSGCLGRVFGVALRRFRTETGWQYYYETAERR